MAGSWIPRLYLYFPSPSTWRPRTHAHPTQPRHICRLTSVCSASEESCQNFLLLQLKLAGGRQWARGLLQQNFSCPSCSSCLLSPDTFWCSAHVICIAKALSCPGREGNTSTPNKPFPSSFLSFFSFLFWGGGWAGGGREWDLQSTSQVDSLGYIESIFFSIFFFLNCQIGSLFSKAPVSETIGFYSGCRITGWCGFAKGGKTKKERKRREYVSRPVQSLLFEIYFLSEFEDENGKEDFTIFN